MFGKSCLSALISGFCFLLLPAEAKSSQGTSGLTLGGAPDSPVRIEVFSDFECPGCRSFYRDVVRPVLQDYASKDKVCVIYHEFPLNTHRYSQVAARYCEAAYRLGREKALLVIDALFAKQPQWSQDGKIEEIVAKTLSSKDLSRIRAILKDPGIDRSIDQGLKLGAERGVRGTPTMFVYYWGKQQKVENAQNLTYPTMKGFIDQIVK